MGERTLTHSLSSDFSKSMQITLGPEWLKQKTKEENQIAHSDSIPDDGRSISPKGRPVTQNQKARIPLKYLRSQSSPLLMQPQVPIPNEENKPVVTGKASTFEDNFPSLSTKSTVQSTASVWKQPPIEAIAKPLNEKTNTHSKSGSNEEKSIHDDLEALKGLIPTAPPPKVIRNKIEGNKRNTPKGAGTAAKPPLTPNKLMSPTSFRKAISEPSLPLLPTYKENYAKLIANGNSKPPVQTGPTEKIDSRNDFFLGLLKEEQKKKGQTDTIEKDHSSGENCESTRNSRSSSNSSSTNNENNDFASQKRYEPTVEDEERFLRNLGWVPEEEDHVPELTEQEILEVRKVIQSDTPHMEGKQNGK